MLSRRYIQSHLLAFLVTFTVLCSSVVSVYAEENDVILSSTSQNETNSIGNNSEGSETGATTSNEAYTGTESSATPALSDSLFSEGTTELPSTSSEKPIVTIFPTSSSPPSMVITATKVAVEHRMLSSETSTDSGENSTEPLDTISEPSSVKSPAEGNNEESFPEKANPDPPTDHAGNDATNKSPQSSRQSRYHRFHDSHAEEEDDSQHIELSGYRQDPDTSTEYMKEMEAGESYGDFAEENEIPEQLPTPMALINPNGEGNNPPLEDDFAEAFKKVNSNGKRRRFRGGRRHRMKAKKLNETNDSNISSSTVGEQDEQLADSKSSGSEWSSHSTTSSPSASPTKLKRYRSTTPNAAGKSSSTTPSSISVEEPSKDEGSSPVVKNGPKPMILQSSNFDESASVVTPLPQIERPGSGGHTEKISTYFFSTPSPSSRLRLRQKIRESLPASPTTEATTSTTAEVSTERPRITYTGSDAWKNEFAEFPQNPFFDEIPQDEPTPAPAPAPVPKKKFKIPDFVPIQLGLETDDRQDQVENSLSRPDPAEKKTYSVGHHHREAEPTSSYGSYDSTYSSSSTTPKSQRVRRPTQSHNSESYTKKGTYLESKPTPTVESEKTERGSEYHAQGSHSEPSTTFPSAHRPTTGSHYDRTKDRVIFYNDSPYSAQHSSTQHSSSAVPGIAEYQSPPPPPPTVHEPTPGSSSQTIGSHLSVSEGPGLYDSPTNPSLTIDHHHYAPISDHNQIGMFTRGQVYPADDVVPQIDSTFKNGPPDSSHIHSPNIIEHSQPLPSPNLVHPESEDLQHLNHPHHNNHEAAYSPQTMTDTHPEQHPSLGRPGGPDHVYGTVEEVSAHGNPSFENHSPYHTHHNHNMHPHLPPGVPYPFNAEHPRGPPPPAPAMSYSPHNPMSPHHLSHHGEHSLPTHPIPPPPLPPPPPSQAHLHMHYPHHQYPPEIHDSFAPPYEMRHPGENNNPHDLTSNTLAGHPSEMSHPHGIMSSSHDDLSDGHQSGTSSSPTSASPPDFPPNNNEAPETAHEPQTIYNGPPPPPPPHMDHFPPHSHTMANQPDYEPANPPLPHDHPFHKSFIPFPPQDLMLHHEHPGHEHPQHDHPGHEANSIADPGNSQYHPGIVDSVPTGRPSSFEPSPLIPAKFTPIPDDVKETDLFNPFASKPYDGPSPTHEHSTNAPTPEDAHSSSQSADHSFQNHQHHSTDPVPTYLGPGGENPYSHHQYHHSDGGMTLNDPNHPDMHGYAGPVHEIHSGTYHSHPPNSIDHPSGDPSESYSYRDPHSHNYDVNEHSLNGHGFGMIDNGEHGPDFKPGESGGHDQHSQEPHTEDDQSPHDGPNDIKSIIHGSGNDLVKAKKRPPQPSFSNTPYVLKFPQLIPEEKMRPSPPSMLSKEIPVIQASSMSDFTSGERPMLGPGFQAVPVHPRHQMYQVLAKTHYEKMMERYRESKKKPPSAIYTPYGILVPVGTSVDAAASMSHNVFAKPRVPPKFRGEKSLLSALLGSSSSSHSRVHPPMMSNRLSKIFEYEPAIDMLAEKLALKIVSAQQVLNTQKKPQSDMAEKSDGKSDESLEKASSQNPSFKDKEDHMTMMESKPHVTTVANPELKNYLKGVLKGQLTEMVETSVSVEDRRPVTLSTKLLNSFFRKGRINSNQPLKASIPTPMIMQGSGSMMMPNKVPPPPGLHTQPSHHHHSVMSHPYPPHGPAGLLGTIRRLFSFAPPEARYEIGIPPNFGGRNMYTINGSHLPYIDGPSPRSSHFPPQIILPHPNMIHQYPPSQHMKSRMATVPAPPQILLPSSGTNSSSTSVATTPKPFKKKKKSSSASFSSSSTASKKTINSGNKSSGQSNDHHVISYSSNNVVGDSKVSTTTVKPNNVGSSVKSSGYFHRNSNASTISFTNNADGRHSFSKKTGGPSTSTASNAAEVSSKAKEDSSDSLNQKTEVVLNKRLGITSSTGSVPISSSASSDSKDRTPTSSKPLDMFQTILGSTRSVLNYFKSSEGRKASGDAPVVVEPISEEKSVVDKETKLKRKRRSLKILYNRT